MRDMRHFLELVGLTAVSIIATASALMHGNVFFGAFFGMAAVFATVQLIRRAVDL
jgi:hypothetical protein